MWFEYVGGWSAVLHVPEALARSTAFVLWLAVGVRAGWRKWVILSALVESKLALVTVHAVSHTHYLFCCGTA